MLKVPEPIEHAGFCSVVVAGAGSTTDNDKKKS